MHDASMTLRRYARMLVLLALLGGCRTTAVLTAKRAEPSRSFQAAIVAITEARLDDAERLAQRQEAKAPAEAALIRLYLAERRHDAAAVHALASGPAGTLLRSDPFMLTALARIRYWTEGLAVARDDLRAACGTSGEPSIARSNACALAAQANALASCPSPTLDGAPGEVKLLAGQSVAVAHASLNGKPPVYFIFDTGAPTTAIARKYADKLKLPYLRDVHESSSDGGGNGVLLNPVVLDSLRVGTSSATGVTAHVIDLPPAFHVGGVLAPQQVFRGAAIEFDLRANVIRVLPAQGAAAWAALTGEPTYSVPVLWVDGNLYVPARINQVSVWILFDTGADRNYACADIAERAGAAPTLAGQAKSKSFTAAGTVEVQEGFQAALAVGDEPAVDAGFMVKACTRHVGWTNLVPPMFGAGYLGTAWLKGRRVLLSSDGRTLVFTAPVMPEVRPAVPNS